MSYEIDYVIGSNYMLPEDDTDTEFSVKWDLLSYLQACYDLQIEVLGQDKMRIQGEECMFRIDGHVLCILFPDHTYTWFEIACLAGMGYYNDVYTWYVLTTEYYSIYFNMNLDGPYDNGGEFLFND